MLPTRTQTPATSAAMPARGLVRRSRATTSSAEAAAGSVVAIGERPLAVGGQARGRRRIGVLTRDDARHLVADDEEEVEDRRDDPQAGLDAPAPRELGRGELRHWRRF